MLRATVSALASHPRAPTPAFASAVARAPPRPRRAPARRPIAHHPRAMASGSTPATTAASASLGRTATPGSTAVADVSAAGAFVRKDAGFRARIEPGGRHPPERDRYHLYVSYACPWACRTLAVLGLKGLEDVVSVTAVHPTWQKTRPNDASDSHAGWAFARPGEVLANPAGVGAFVADDKCAADPNHDDVAFVRDLYDKVGAPPGTRFTVPVLWDKTLGEIVSNESSEIIRDLYGRFDAFAKRPDLDLYPERLRAEIDEINEWVYHGINNGVYKCGFATSQAAYDEACAELFACLDRCEAILEKRRFIAGDVLTEADVRLFHTLVRFDEVYVVYFKTNKKAIREYANLSAYVRDVYQTPGMRQSVDMAHIKTHYFTSHPVLNAHAIVPMGPETDLDAPHGRDTREY